MYLLAFLSLTFHILKVRMSVSTYSFFFVFTRGHFFIALKKRGRERERETSMSERERHWLVASCTHPDWGLYTLGQGIKPQPRYVPWLRIEPATFWLQDDVPTNELHQPGLYFFECEFAGIKQNNSFQILWKYVLKCNTCDICGYV